MKDVTIVIPAYKPVSLLKKCIDSIIQNTDLNKVEVLIVCNGSEKESVDYLLSNEFVRFIWYKEALGFTKAANIGLKHASTPYIILMNTDFKILPYKSKHDWVSTIIDPIKADPSISVTGPADMYILNRMYLPFFCVGLQKELLERFNYLDEAFSPGYGEDIDFCFKTTQAGFKLLRVGNTIVDHENRRYITDFPGYHSGQGSFGEEGARIALEHEEIIKARYN